MATWTPPRKLMRKAGLAKADKKASRVAAEGVIVSERSADGKRAAIVEVNCETDFVAREKDFQHFASAVAKVALRAASGRSSTRWARSAIPGGQSVEETRRALIAKIGENISVRRFQLVEAPAVVGAYLHGTRIGALVAMKSRRRCGRQGHRHARRRHQSGARHRRRKCRPTRSPRKSADFRRAGRERPEERRQAARASLEKIVEGKVRKWLNEITLLGQPFVKDDKQTVEQYLKKAGGEVLSIVRYEVGAGIEKKQEDFAEEVRKQVESAKKALIATGRARRHCDDHEPRFGGVLYNGRCSFYLNA